MRGYAASSVIRATPEAVWAVLVDGAHWTQWDSAVVRLDGQIELGAPMIFRSIPDLGPSFTRFADGLKRRVES